jgi:hypothetical protein
MKAHVRKLVALSNMFPNYYALVADRLRVSVQMEYDQDTFDQLIDNPKWTADLSDLDFTRFKRGIYQVIMEM